MDAKQLAGEAAASWVKDGMLVGLGTGSTVYWTIQKLGQRVSQDGLRIRGVATSTQTAELAQQLGIPLTTLEEVDKLDVAIDGADEFNAAFDLIKGGGGALVREKLVALAADRFVVVADESKQVDTLGRFPLPVEVLPFAWNHTAQRIASLGCEPRLRERNGKPFVTDNGNYILDCPFGSIPSPSYLHKTLKQQPGVVETGLFVGLPSAIIVSDGETVQTLQRPLRHEL